MAIFPLTIRVLPHNRQKPPLAYSKRHDPYNVLPSWFKKLSRPTSNLSTLFLSLLSFTWNAITYNVTNRNINEIHK